MANILILDIETAPNIAYVWGAWKQNVGQNQWVQKSHIMSFAAKWLDRPEIYYVENRTSDDKNIVRKLFQFLEEADVVVAHNGSRFDLPTILGRGVSHGFPPPSPYAVVDTLLVARREFRFVSNSLASLCKELGLSEKKSHANFPGFELWLECLRDNDAAWREMEEYNVQDVLSLEALYLRLRPYMRNHPNIARPDDAGVVLCPKCGGSHVQYRGYYATATGNSYRRFQCNACGGWGRVRRMEKTVPVNAGVNAV